MEQIGKVFRQLRESRNISLRQATGGQFSPSMLSRFETGQSELSVEKFLFALENISASVEEILFLARGFQYDTDSDGGLFFFTVHHLYFSYWWSSFRSLALSSIGQQFFSRCGNQCLLFPSISHYPLFRKKQIEPVNVIC